MALPDLRDQAIRRTDDDLLAHLNSFELDLLIRAFAGQVLEALPVPGLAEGLDEALDASLARARGETT